MKRYPVITAVDIGTSKICCIIAMPTDQNRLEVKGIAVGDSEGIERGMVKDIQKTAECIRNVIEEAERRAECRASNLYICIAGEYIRSRTQIGRISISDSLGKDPTEITREHIEAVINDACRAVNIQPDVEKLKIVHAIPQFFDIDDDKNIPNPIHMHGFHLTAHVHVMMADTTAIRNINRCMEFAGYPEPTIVLQPIASAEAVLNTDEKELGCILLDIGGGTTDVAVYYRGAVHFSAVKALGGENITHDMAVGLGTPTRHAEILKIEHGNCYARDIGEDETIEVPGINGRDSEQRKLKYVATIIQSRMKEILDIAYNTIFSSYKEQIPLTAQIVMTGGVSMMKNVEKLTRDVFNLQPRIGHPDLSRLSGKVNELESPVFATAVGLLYYAIKQKKDTFTAKPAKGTVGLGTQGPGFFARIGEWLKDFL